MLFKTKFTNSFHQSHSSDPEKQKQMGKKSHRSRKPTVTSMPVAAGMEIWSSIIGKLNPDKTRSLAMIDTKRDPSKTQAAFFKAFNKLRDECSNTLVTVTGVYHFRGATAPERAELIGIPELDTVLYISNAGRVAMTGSGAAEVAALLA